MSVEPLKESHQNLSFQKSKNPKIPTQVSDFWKLKIQKKNKTPRVSKNPKIQKSQPQFRIFGNSRNLLKIQKNQNSSSFQKSKNPKIPTPVSDFWKLEEFAQNPKKPKIPRVSKIPKIQESQPQFRIFGNSRNLLKIQKNPKFLEFPKFQKSKNPNPSFGFLETRGICSKSKKTKNSSSFQNSKNPKIPTPVSDFWKLEEFWVFLDFEQIPRVSKNPKLWDFWIFGFLETRGILGFFGF